MVHIRPYLDSAARERKDRVVLIGIAQEKASVWRSWPRKGQEKARHPHMDWDREMAFINHFYFYLWDAEWGGAFWKTNSYAPYPIWLWLAPSFGVNTERSRPRRGSGRASAFESDAAVGQTVPAFLLHPRSRGPVPT